MSVGYYAYEGGRPNACWTKLRASMTRRSHDERHAALGPLGGPGRLDPREWRSRVRYLQCALTIPPSIRTRQRLARMCAHVAPWEIANKNSKSIRFDDRREKLKNGGNIAGQESAIFGSGCVKILSRANCVACVRCRSQSFRLKKGLVDLIKECRMALWSQPRVRMSYPLVGGGGSRFGVATRSWPPPEVKRGE